MQLSGYKPRREKEEPGARNQKPAYLSISFNVWKRS